MKAKWKPLPQFSLSWLKNASLREMILMRIPNRETLVDGAIYIVPEDTRPADAALYERNT